jgi:hypothetical protein
MSSFGIEKDGMSGTLKSGTLTSSLGADAAAGDDDDDGGGASAWTEAAFWRSTANLIFSFSAAYKDITNDTFRDQMTAIGGRGRGGMVKAKV